MRSLHYYLNAGKRRDILNSRKEAYLRYVCDQTGWDYEKAKQEMDEYAKKGVNYRYYVKKRIWARTGKRLEISLKNVEKDSRYDKRSLDKHAGLVARESGLSKKKVKEMILESNLYTECSPRDYYQFRFWEKTLEEQKTYYTKGTVERLIMKYNTDLDEVTMIRSKERFAKKFGDLFHRVWFVNRNISFEEFLEKTEGLTSLICKPTFGTHGAGVEKFDIPHNLDEKRALYDLLMEKGKSQCEEYIVQHFEIAAFCASSVNTVRLVTILDQGKVNYMYSVLRMGTGGLIDGFDGGGIFAPVDVENGIICRDGMNLEGTIFKAHPVSQKPIKGFQIPNWDEVLKLAETAAKRLQGVHMVGWDIAVTENGASLIEGNTESNYQFAQLPYIAEGIGVKYKFDPFLK
ncbi:sugar-transfer associated ATP-grasp domain-containing protein [Ihubacter sp. rT4E-8]|uniref:sugar-transfer associated ATP-grasp domain-containing protein n=1 Tax=Ihubacter sp. rT4E-8 TaxID=3242369 RepID=UPI003CF4EDEA